MDIRELEIEDKFRALIAWGSLADELCELEELEEHANAHPEARERMAELENYLYSVGL